MDESNNIKSVICIAISMNKLMEILNVNTALDVIYHPKNIEVQIKDFSKYYLDLSKHKEIFIPIITGIEYEEDECEQ